MKRSYLIGATVIVGLGIGVFAMWQFQANRTPEAVPSMITTDPKRTIVAGRTTTGPSIVDIMPRPDPSGTLSPGITTTLPHVSSPDALAGREVPPGTFVAFPIEIEAVATRLGVSTAEATEILWFEAAPASRVAEGVLSAFRSDVVNTTYDSLHRKVIIYVSDHAAEARTLAETLMGNDGTVEVRGGYLPLDEIRPYWQALEQALTDAGLVVAGALRPNEIRITTGNAERTQAIIDTFELPSQIAVTLDFIPGFAGFDLSG